MGTGKHAVTRCPAGDHSLAVNMLKRTTIILFQQVPGVQGIHVFSIGSHCDQVNAMASPRAMLTDIMMYHTNHLVPPEDILSTVMANEVLLSCAAKMEKLPARFVYRRNCGRSLKLNCHNGFPKPIVTDKDTIAFETPRANCRNVSASRQVCCLFPPRVSLTHDAMRTWSSHHRPRCLRNLQYTRRARNRADRAVRNQMVKLICGPKFSVETGTLKFGLPSLPAEFAVVLELEKLVAGTAVGTGPGASPVLEKLKAAPLDWL